MWADRNPAWRSGRHRPWASPALETHYSAHISSALEARYQRRSIPHWRRSTCNPQIHSAYWRRNTVHISVPHWRHATHADPFHTGDAVFITRRSIPRTGDAIQSTDPFRTGDAIPPHIHSALETQYPRRSIPHWRHSTRSDPLRTGDTVPRRSIPHWRRSTVCRFIPHWRHSTPADSFRTGDTVPTQIHPALKTQYPHRSTPHWRRSTARRSYWRCSTARRFH